MLRSKSRTQGRKYPRRKYWIQRRDKVFERADRTCEISGDDLFVVKHGEDCTDGQCDGFDDGYCKFKWKRAVDHLFPERWIRRFIPGADPHCYENLHCVSMRIHSMKTSVERRIYSGDFIGYCTELRRIGFQQHMIDCALKALYESAKAKAVKNANADS
jgi:hypothetical protein